MQNLTMFEINKEANKETKAFMSTLVFVQTL